MKKINSKFCLENIAHDFRKGVFFNRNLILIYDSAVTINWIQFILNRIVIDVLFWIHFICRLSG